MSSMNSDNRQPTDDQEKLRKQAEDQAKVEDAVRWGMFEGEEPTTRTFVVTLKRTVHRELTQFADLEIEAASESVARATAERMIAEEAKEIAWEDGGNFYDDPGNATVDWVEEAKNGDDDGGAEEEL
jgi:hypothetical protein